MALPHLHPKIQEALEHSGHGTIIDGAMATEAIDTSGEIVNIKGMDISSLNEDGVLNTEHINPDSKQFKDGETPGQWSSIVGRIVFAKKIFDKKDCESERELNLWESIKLPFLYGVGELFDSEGHENAKALSSMIKHYHDRNLPLVVRFSIEGSTLERQGQHLVKTVARRCALTIKPCNKSSYNFLVAPSNPQVQSFEQISTEKSEKDLNFNISVLEMEYFPKIEDPLVVARQAIEEIKELNKTMTLGGAGASPSALTGGAALAVEDVEDAKRRKMFEKSQVLAALRDWDKVTKFEEFLKHKFPDADESILDRFADLASQIRMSKTEIQKNEVLAKAGDEFDTMSGEPQLPKLQNNAPSGSKLFRNKYVKPGKIEIVDGIYRGNKLPLLNVSDDRVYVIPPKAGGSNVRISSIPRKLENHHYKILERPEDLKLPNFVDSSRHSIPEFSDHFEQKDLIHGIDLAQKPESSFGASTVDISNKPDHTIGWYRNHSGKNVYVKPSVIFKNEDLSHKSDEYISTGRREALFYNLAKSFWKLGDYVPTTAVFKHPDTEHDYSAMAQVENGRHFVKWRGDKFVNHLESAAETGDLQKLAIMDMAMGNSDRNRFNYLLTEAGPRLRLIDNSLIFNYSKPKIPEYLNDHHFSHNSDVTQDALHENARHWLVNLDPLHLKSDLLRYGVHENIANKAASKLLLMQSAAMMGENKLLRILMAQ